MSEAKLYTEEYVSLNGIHQYFLHYPSPQKEVVIFLHGGPGSPVSLLAYNIKPYWDFCSYIHYDQRGAGRTLKKNKTKTEDLTLEILLADLKETISYVKEKYSTDRVILLGQSWGSVLGTQYVLKYPNDVICYIGNGHVIHTRREMQLSYDKLEQKIKNAGAKGDAKKLSKLSNYPNVSKEEYFGDMYRIGRLQSKYGQAVDSKTWKAALKSPLFKLSDIYLMIKGIKLNKELACTLLDYSIWDVTEYQLPVYYILGRNDWQTPSTLAAEYFEKINAPRKGLYWIENAGHITDVDNPIDFCNAVKDIVAQL